MNSLEQLDRCLATERNPNARSDDWVRLATKLIDELSLVEWGELIGREAARPTEWRVRLLDAACSAGHREERAVPLALALLSSEDLATVHAAVEALARCQDVLHLEDPVCRALEKMLGELAGT